MAGSKGGKGGAKGEGKAGAAPASSGGAHGTTAQQQQGQGEEARRRREDLIRRYLLQRLQAAEAEAASSAGAGADSSSSSGSDGQGGSAADGASAASAAAFLQLLSEASVRQSDVRVAIRRAAREQGIPQKKAKLLESLEARLARHGPIFYQNASVTAGTPEWQQGRVKEKERCTAEASRFEAQLDFFELKPEATTQKLLDKSVQAVDASPVGAAAAALAANRVDVRALKIPGLRGHPALFEDSLPTPAELAAPPCGPDAAAAAGRRLRHLADQLLEELGTLQQVARMVEAEQPLEDLVQLGRLPARCSDLESHVRNMQMGGQVADDVLEALDSAVWTQRMVTLLNGPRQIIIPMDVLHESDTALALLAAVRGHLLMQLQAKAAAQGWTGAPAELQRALLPLADGVERGDASAAAEELLTFACSEAGIDAERPLEFLELLQMPYANQRGMIWRTALLLLPLLAAAPPLALPPAWGSSGGSAAGAASETSDSAAGELQAGGSQPALPVDLPPADSAEAAAAAHEVHAAAARLAHAERQRGMAAAIVLALSRMQLRRRLYDETVLGLACFIQSELSTGALIVRDMMQKLGALAPDSLLLAYAYVAVMFGRAFASSDELGGTAAGLSRMPWIAALGAADYTLASHLSVEGALAWEPLSGGGGSGNGSSAAGSAQLRLKPCSVEAELHYRAAEKYQQQQQPQQAQPGGEAPPLVTRLPGTHCQVGWCTLCRDLLPPDASAQAKAEALAALVSGTTGGSALLHAGAAYQDTAGVQLSLDAAQRLLSDEPLLAGTPSEATPEVLLDEIHTLHILGATFNVLENQVREVAQKARDSLRLVEVAAAALVGPGDRALPIRADTLKQHCEVAHHLGELQRRVQVAQLLFERLELLANHHRLQQAQDMAREANTLDGKAGPVMALVVDSLEDIVRAKQHNIAALQHALDNPRESGMWATQLGITLKVLHAGAAQHEAHVASGAFRGVAPPYFPPKAVGSKLAGAVEEMRDTTRSAHILAKRLDATSTSLHLRAQSLACELRRLCSVNLLLPLEEFVLQHMLGPRWEKEALALLGEGSGADSAAAEQAAAEEAARRLLEEETAREEAAARRRQQKEERQRAAEQKRLAELEEKRRAEQEEQRRAAAERRRQEQEAAERQRAAEEAAAREAVRRQREAFHAAAAEAGLSEEEEEEESEGEGEGGAAAAAGEGRRKYKGHRGGARERRKQEARKAQEAAAAAAIPGFSAPPPAGKPPNKKAPTAAPAAAPSATPAPAAAAATVPAKQQGAAATPAVAAGNEQGAAAAHLRPASPGQQQQQPAVQAKVQPMPQQTAQQQRQRPASPHDRPLPLSGNSGSMGSAGSGRVAGGGKPAIPAAAAASDGKPRILTVVRPKPRQLPEPPAVHAAVVPAAEVRTAPAPAPVAAAQAAAPVAAEVAPATAPAVQAPAAAEPSAAAPAAPAAVAPAEPAAPAVVAAPPAAAPAEQSMAAVPAAAAQPVAAPAARAVAAAAAPPAVVEPAAEQKPAGPVPGSWAALAAKKPDKPAATPVKEQAPSGERPAQQAQQRGQAAAEPAAVAAEPPAAWPELGGKAAVAASPERVSTPEPAAAAPAMPAAAVPAAAPAAAAAEAAAAPAAPATTWGKPGLNFLAALAPEQAEVAMLALPGLRNEAGEFNCFLNVVLQCLWRCADFRAEVLGWAPEIYRGDGVLKALHGLFCELTALDMHSKEAAAAAAGGGSPPQRRPVIDPTPLREALNALPSQEFKMGEMSDAGELLLVLYEHIKTAAPAEAAAAAVDRAFGLHIAEAVRCRKCGRVTQEGRYTQHFYNVPAAALRGSLRVGSDPGFGACLRALEDAHQKTCDTDVGGCGAPWPVSQRLQEGAPPRIFTLQLVWESHNQEPSTIGATLRAVGETVDLSQLYAGVPGGARYRLRSLACYYGRHYSAFVRLPELHDRWVMFDDASASAIGTWADVRRRCEGGRIQPSVLFYEAEFEQ